MSNVVKLPDRERPKPPMAIDAERLLLGAFLLNEGNFLSVGFAVRPTDFYRADHRHIFDAIRKGREALVGGAEKILIETLRVLTENGRLQECGGETYLWELLDLAVATCVDGEFVRCRTTVRELRNKADERMRLLEVFLEEMSR